MLGQGSYGQVTKRNGKAVKKFAKLSHLIQEYIALKYLHECNYVVHTTGCDTNGLELSMELYDTSLRKWLDAANANNGLRETNPSKFKSSIDTVLSDVLCGLIELHDRNLAHGDIKPGNILVRKEPIKAVLGDCGFVSIAKYSKTERTAAVYRDPIVGHDTSHDMFSFGIILLEVYGNIKINRQASYKELRKAITDKIVRGTHKDLLLRLLHENKEERPTAKETLNILFNRSFSTNVDFSTTDGNSAKLASENVHKKMKLLSRNYNLNRGKKGLNALIAYLIAHNIPEKDHLKYMCVTLMILSACFGKQGFRENEAMLNCVVDGNRHVLTESQIHEILNKLMNNDVFIKSLMTP